MPDNVYSSFAFLGFVLVLIPLPWHLQAWNAGTCLFMIWTALGCLIYFVNSILWAGNFELHSAPWCDISSKLIVGLSVALPCASLCINRRLYEIASVPQVSFTMAENRRAVYIDLAIGIGFPVIIMALHYTVQGHRFDIFEDIGCWPSTFNTPPAYPLVWMWPIVIGFISMIFCVLSSNALLRRRKEFKEFLAINTTLNVNRYFRLIALATIIICVTTPLAIYFMYLNLATEEVSPWIGWSDTKWHFSRIDYVQAVFVDTRPLLKLNFTLNLWLLPVLAILFFVFFGFAEEARRNYLRFFSIIVAFFNNKLPFYNQRTANGGPAKVSVTLPTITTCSVEGGSFKAPDFEDDVGSSPLTTPTQKFYSHVPPVTITHAPSTEATEALIPSAVSQQLLLQQRLACNAVSKSPSFRRSISTDFGITVSPAYLPDAESASHYHDEAFLTREIPRSTCGSKLPVHGGIRITVEKTAI